MDACEDVQLRQIERRAWQRTGALAGALVRADSQAREGILAQMQFERWIAECCGLCLQGS